ncbi:hypothetical protein NC653_022052 [Populus alba x Populus x berolinensis]|uniref:G domain-containing protein n=1 Tax=Populus alba x Populus x berolinensis TaxID=444605 RepID=A0AAD6QFC4_9ROSI|nr:hypothetical protein NC653_022052 [Populus alba x Populus x berolinensis]
MACMNRWSKLELVADVGIVGAPNAWKSTLSSVTSAAQPAFANYLFTTLLPNLSVVSFDYDSTMVLADLPGLLEEAHQDFGLGTHEVIRAARKLLQESKEANKGYKDSERRFQHVLEAFGVNKPLSKMGVKEGDSVIVGESIVSRILIGLSNVKKLSFDPTKWSGSNPSVLNSKITKLQVVDVTNRWICYLYDDLFLNLCGIYPSNDHWKELAEQEFRYVTIRFRGGSSSLLSCPWRTLVLQSNRYSPSH